MHDAARTTWDTAVPAPTNGSGQASALRVGRLVAYSWLIAAAAIGVLNLLHADLHEHNELPPAFHWLRDASLAVPLAAIAGVMAALLLRPRVAMAAGGRGRSIAAPLGWAIVASLLFALFSIPGIQLHALLFGAEEESVGWLEDALKDGGITLAVSLVALVPAVLMTGPPWRAARSPDEPAHVPGPTLVAAAGPSASQVTARFPRGGGDR